MRDGHPLPEARALVQRAAMARFQLDALLDVIGEDALDRAPESGWSVRENVAHVVAVDRIVLEMLVAGTAIDPRPYLAQRDQRRLEHVGLGWAELRESLDSARRDLSAAVLDLAADALSSRIEVRGTLFEPGWSMEWRTYLLAWAQHDASHEAAIREALRTALNPAVLAATLKVRRQG